MAFTGGGALALRLSAGARSATGGPATGTLLPTITITPESLASAEATLALVTPTSTMEELEAATEASLPAPVEPSQTPEPSETSGPLAQDAWCVPWNSKTVQAQVNRVIDGISIEVRLDGKLQQVRYTGVELLEYDQDWRVWAESTEKNRQLVEGKTVLLISGQADTDSQGRLRRYVIANGLFVNRAMVASGYAIAQSMPPDTGCDGQLLEAETQAITAGIGLWAATPTPTRTFPAPTATVPSAGDVVIVKVSFVGTAWQLPEQFVEIYNSGTSPVELEGWSVSDIRNHVFVFPRFVLGPGQYCRVYTNLYAPNHCGFSYYNPAPIWDKNGDCAYLKDKTGKLVDQFCYE